MIFLDTNVLIYAADRGSRYWHWARETLADAVAGGGAVINTVVLAEVCVGDLDPDTAADRIRSWGVEILDLPTAAAPVCAKAYLAYRQRRAAESGEESPRLPLPDFFIGAHAEIMGWPLATADPGRFKTYFSSVELQTP
ncbi:MAG: type II toxin-antitoxin system VapC family toxin [Thermoanaerobaculia bacterium]